MERDNEQREDELVDLGAVSAETKGILGRAVDLPSGQPQTGILDD